MLCFTFPTAAHYLTEALHCVECCVYVCVCAMAMFKVNHRLP